MHLSRSFLVISFLVTSVRAASNLSLSELVPRIPPCALGCLVTGLSSNAEVLAHPAISCLNITLQASLSTCVQGKCNYTEQAKLGLLNEELCEGIPIDESRVWATAIIGLVCGPLALIAIALRIYSRYSLTKQLGLDDWVMLAAAPLLIALTAIDIENALGQGFGRHYWNIDPFKVVPLLKIFFIAELLYVLVTTMVKTSILLFYLRVFPGRLFRIMDIILQGINISAGLAILIAIIFQCTPISGAWDRTITPKCINLNILAYATGGIAVALDIVIIALPIPSLLGLKMNFKKKLHVIFMFSIGIVALVTSIVRFKYLLTFATSTDATWDNALPAVWSLLEICIAVICACLPAMRALFSLWVPSIFNSDSIIRSDKLAGHKAGSSYLGQSSSQGSKIEPSYAKRAIDTPDQELLTKIGNKGGMTCTRIWVNPHFDEHGNALKVDDGNFEYTSNSKTPSSRTSIFALEGPRESDEIAMLERQEYPMQHFGTSPPKGDDNLIRVETTMTTHSVLNPYFKRLPPLPARNHNPP